MDGTSFEKPFYFRTKKERIATSTCDANACCQTKKNKKISAKVTEDLSHKCINVSFDLLNFIEINDHFSHKYIYVRLAEAPRPILFFGLYYTCLRTYS